MVLTRMASTMARFQISLRGWALLIVYVAAIIALYKGIRVAILTYHP